MLRTIRNFLRRAVSAEWDAPPKTAEKDTQEKGKDSKDSSVNNVTQKRTARDSRISGSVTETSYVPWETEKPNAAADTKPTGTPRITGSPGTPGDTESPGTPGDTESPGTPGDTESPGTPGDTESPGTLGYTAKLNTTVHIEASHITRDSVTLNTAEDTETLGSIGFKLTPGKSGISVPSGTQADTSESGARGDKEDTWASGAAGITQTLGADTAGQSTGSFTERSLERSLSNPASRTNPDLHENHPSGFSQKFVTIWFWNEESSVLWLSDYLNMYSSIKELQLKDCRCVCLKGEQISQNQAIDTPLCIIVYCDCSEELQNYMERFLYCGITENGSQSFLVIIGGFTDEMSMNQMREEWVKGPFSSCKLLLFTKKDIEFLKQLSKNKAKSWRNMNQELENITEIISKESKSNMTKDASSQNTTKNNEKLPIGIFSWSEDEWPWFHKLLKKRLPGDEFKHFTYRQSFSIGRNRTQVDHPNCSFYIFLVTKEWPSDPRFISLYMERNVLAEERNVLAVIDVEVTTSRKRMRNHQKRSSSIERTEDTVKVTKEQKSIYELFFQQNDVEAVTRIHKQLSELEELVSDRVKCHKIREEEEYRESGFVKNQKTCSSSTVGIFSRSAESDYEWLQVLLRSESFRDQIQDVRPFYISNNKMTQFIDDVQQCKFGILYHTMNRGRINITDVRDSLYDEELELMSEYLGSDNVLVVADDLDDSSGEEKQRILESQPKIRKFAADLLLVAETEKKDETCLLKKLKGLNLFISENDILTTAL